MHGHHQMVITEVRFIIYLLHREMEKHNTVSKIRPELTVVQIIDSLLQNSGLN